MRPGHAPSAALRPAFQAPPQYPPHSPAPRVSVSAWTLPDHPAPTGLSLPWPYSPPPGVPLTWFVFPPNSGPDCDQAQNPKELSGLTAPQHTGG